MFHLRVTGVAVAEPGTLYNLHGVCSLAQHDLPLTLLYLDPEKIVERGQITYLEHLLHL